MVKKLLLTLFLIVMIIVAVPLFYIGFRFISFLFESSHPKYKFSPDRVITDETRIPMVNTNLPYGDWLLWNKEIKITVRENQTYTICYKNECETKKAIICFKNKCETTQNNKGRRDFRLVSFENFFETKAGKKYLSWDYYNVHIRKKNGVEPVRFGIQPERCHLPPSGWCNRWVKPTIRNTFVYQETNRVGAN